jgi:hypothetical protein
MFPTISIKHLVNFRQWEGHRFGFQNLEDWKSWKFKMEPGPTCVGHLSQRHRLTATPVTSHHLPPHVRHHANSIATLIRSLDESKATFFSSRAPAPPAALCSAPHPSPTTCYDKPPWNPRMHYALCISPWPYLVENSLVMLCLADRILVEVEWQTPLVRFRAFYTMVRDWNGLRKWLVDRMV